MEQGPVLGDRAILLQFLLLTTTIVYLFDCLLDNTSDSVYSSFR